MLYNKNTEIGKIMHNGVEICKGQFGPDRVYTKLETQLQEAGVGLALLPKRADGYGNGTNTPFTNPLVDVANKVGKNLIDIPIGNVTTNGITAISNGNKITLNGTSTTSLYLKISGKLELVQYFSNDWLKTLVVKKDVGTVISSIHTSGITSLVSMPVLSHRTKGNIGILPSNPSSPNSIPVLLTDDIAFSYLFINIGITFTNFTIQPQLELGSVATTYEPYKKNNCLLTNFAGTAPDGWDNQAIISSAGANVDYENLVVNGDFVNGTIGWGSNSVVGFASVTGIAEFTATLSGGKILHNIALQNGNRYYVSSKVKAKSNLINCNIAGVLIASHDGSDVFKNLSNIITWTPASGTWELRIADFRTSAWDKVFVDNIQLLNLTTNPYIQAIEARLGRQLTVAECDRIFPFVVAAGRSKVGIMPFLKFDGINSYGILPNNPAIDIVGLDEFEISKCFMTDNTLINSWILFKGLDAAANSQFGLLLQTDGRVGFYLNGVDITVCIAGSININNVYVIKVGRKNGSVYCKLKEVEKYNQPNIVNITTKPNYRLGCRSASIDGVTNSAFTNVFDAGTLITKNPQNWDALDKVTERAFRGYFGPAPIVLGPILKDLNGNPILDVNGNIIRTS